MKNFASFAGTTSEYIKLKADNSKELQLWMSKSGNHSFQI